MWIAAGLALLTAVTFAQLRDFSFVDYDDFQFVVDNSHVSSGLTLANLRWAWRNPYLATGGPLTWMSHMLDIELFATWAGGHHLTSLALHTVAALVLFALLRCSTRSIWRSAFVAAAFAVHPLHVESVAWVSERKDVLSGLFFFLTLGAYGWYVARPGIGRYATVVILFAAALLSKPMVATLPCVLLLIDVWPLARLVPGRMPSLVLEKVPLLLLALLAMWLTLHAQVDRGAVTGGETIPATLRLANGLFAYGAYLGKTIWPFGLIPFYPFRFDIPAAVVAGAALLLAVPTALALALRRRMPFVLIGWLWFVGMLVPVIGLVQVGEHGMADRFTYLPLVGIFITAAWGVTSLVERPMPRRLLAIGATLLVLAWAWVARVQAEHWRDGIALWTHTVQVQPDNARGHANLGAALARRDRHADAIRAYERSIQLEPRVAQVHHNLGLSLEAIGRDAEAIPHHREAVRLRTDYADAHMHLANLLAQAEETQEAIEHYREATRLRPTEALIHVNLAVTLGRSGRPADALPHMLEAIRLEPRSVQWRYFAGLMLIEVGRREEARQMLQSALTLEPSHRDARAALAVLDRF